jgi:hypothetical protein
MLRDAARANAFSPDFFRNRCGVAARAHKTDQFWLESLAQLPRLGGAQDNEGFAVFGRPEGVHMKQRRDSIPVADICGKAGISQATYFNWKKKYDGLLPDETHCTSENNSYPGQDLL